MKKIIFAVIMALLVSIVCVPWSVSGAAGVSVTVDGKAVNFPDAKPFIDMNGRTLIPVRFVTESLGATVGWNEDYQEVTIKKGNVDISIMINDRNIVVSGKIKTMDTEAIIKESRTFVPIRYVAEGLGAKVGWNPNTKTVIITTEAAINADIPNAADYYKINPDMPKELYTYEYRKDSHSGWYATNKWMVDRYGVKTVTDFMNVGKGYIETCYNVDYRTFDKKEYIEKLKWYFMPRTNWYGGDGKSRPILEHLDYLANMIVEKQIVIKTKFITDPSLILSDEDTIIRGRAVYTIESCNDMEWVNKFFPFGESELGKEHARDMDIEIANLEQKDDWEHSIKVLYGEYLLAVIK
ncbi:copper amine oxidase N-terminal domain-containing protein [Acetivibrio cellulolyticus]|uniref:copper amine oxidase N-terminal domain-containing protein n=1 Tax=Acetivibrio cellulolyticus TaxID=35830 RepID=UPI0001E2D995|nr:copper amine oxidase N-terminal domain-containing protein [Acetivibrio cellulolyticus]